MVCGDKRAECFDLRDRRQLKRIEGNLTDPRSLLGRAMQAVKFQDGQGQKYVAHLEKRCADAEAERDDLRGKCAEYEEQLSEERKQPRDQRPDIEAVSEHSEFTVSRFGTFAERRVPPGHPSSTGKSSIMRSAFTNKLSESSRGASALTGTLAENLRARQATGPSTATSAVTRETLRRGSGAASHQSGSAGRDQLAHRRFTNAQTKSNQLARLRSHQSGRP